MQDSDQQQQGPQIFRASDYTRGDDDPRRLGQPIARESSSPPPPPALSRDSAARERMRRRRVKGQRTGGEWAWVIIAAALLGVVVTISLGLALLVRGTQSSDAVLAADSMRDSDDFSLLPTPVDMRRAYLPGLGFDRVVLDDGTEVVLDPWDGQGRLTVLVMGLDRRPDQDGLAFRTDTLLLLSLDTASDDIGVLSIPRDLWVNVPGYGLRRINEPMVLGELREVGYGPTLAMETVQLNFGIRVNHYVAVDFRAFITIVDAVGGVGVETDYSINDRTYPSMNYGYDPFYLPAGQHVLDGETALKFARTRHGDSDIERGERQQQVIFGILDKVADPANLPNLLLKVPDIWAALDGNFYTDLSLDQMISLGLYVKDIPRDQIKTGGVSYREVSSYTTPSGAQVLIPVRSRLSVLMAEVFGENYSQ